jgi:hypothetical protein
MVDHRVLKYIDDNIKYGYTRDKIMGELKKQGWPEEDLEKGYSIIEKRHRRHHLLLYAIPVLIMLILCASAFFYLNYVDSTFAKKPLIEKPPMIAASGSNSTGQVKISGSHIQYIANEMGAYKLHSDPRTSEKAEIEFVVTDSGDAFTVIVENNFPGVSEGNATRPDLRIRTVSGKMAELLSADDFTKKAVELVKSGDVSIEVISDEATLAVKGYKAIYDALKKDSGLPTGQFIWEFDRKISIRDR